MKMSIPSCPGRFGRMGISLDRGGSPTLSTFAGDDGSCKASSSWIGIDAPDPAHLKLTNFGFAVRLQRGQKTTGARGAEGYAAPELFRDRGDGRREYGHNVDCWAATVLFFTTLTNGLPFAEPKEVTFYSGKISSESGYKELMPENMRAFVETVFLVHAHNPEYCTPERLIQLLEQYQAQSGEAAYAMSSSLLRDLGLDSELVLEENDAM